MESKDKNTVTNFFLRSADGEVARRAISYALRIPPDGELHCDSELLDPVLARFRGEDIRWEFQRHNTTSIRLVCKEWNDDVQRLRDQFGVIEFYPWGVVGIRSKEQPRLRRLLIVASGLSDENLRQLSRAIDNAPYLIRLQMELYCWTGNFVNMETSLWQILRVLFLKGYLRVFQWNGPAFDVLSCASDTSVNRLLLHNLPTYNAPFPRLNLRNLSHLIITLASPFTPMLYSSFIPRPPPSNVILLLCYADTSGLISLSVTSGLGFPHLKRYLHEKRNQLVTLRIREAYEDNKTTFCLLPTMHRLRTCGVQLYGVQDLLGDGVDRRGLTKLDLFGFYRTGLDEQEIRMKLAVQLLEAGRFLKAQKGFALRDLTSIRLDGLSITTFRVIPWSRFQRACFSYVFLLLNRVGIRMSSDDDHLLDPALMQDEPTPYALPNDEDVEPLTL